MKRLSRAFLKRYDSRGREIWYQLGSDGSRKKISRPRALRKGDTVLDATADGPTRLRHGGRGKGLKKTPISAKVHNQWTMERLRGVPTTDPTRRAREGRDRLVRGRRKLDPDRVRVFHLSEDGRERRFTISSFERFQRKDKYRDARERLSADRFVLGIADKNGSLREEVETLIGEGPEED